MVEEGAKSSAPQKEGDLMLVLWCTLYTRKVRHVFVDDTKEINSVFIHKDTDDVCQVIVANSTSLSIVNQ